MTFLHIQKPGLCRRPTLSQVGEPVPAPVLWSAGFFSVAIAELLPLCAFGWIAQRCREMKSVTTAPATHAFVYPESCKV